MSSRQKPHANEEQELLQTQSPTLPVRFGIIDPSSQGSPSKSFPLSYEPYRSLVEKHVVVVIHDEELERFEIGEEDGVTTHQRATTPDTSLPSLERGSLSRYPRGSSQVYEEA